MFSYLLMICGLYQLFGEYFETVDGTRLDGTVQRRLERLRDSIGSVLL